MYGTFCLLGHFTNNWTIPFIKAILNGRRETGLNREELARKVNEPVSVISKCETPGSPKPDLKVLMKLEKALKIHLRGESPGLYLSCLMLTPPCRKKYWSGKNDREEGESRWHYISKRGE